MKADVLPVPLVCAACHGSLDQRPELLTCVACGRTFPIIAGIPDLRIEPDPWIGLDADRTKALRVLEEAAGLDLEGHVRAYWRLTPSTATQHAERYVRHVLHAADRSREWLALSAPVNGGDHPPLLDLGCGTADLAEAATGTTVVGVDIAMRWLVIARRRLLDLGLPANLVCANAEALPFPEGSFSRVLSLGMVEHCRSFDLVAGEAHRVLSEGGTFRLRTTNRFSLLPEPHVGLLGVGYLPRAWADSYVRMLGGQGYTHHHPSSARQLRRGLRRAGFQLAAAGAAPVLPTEVAASAGAVQTTASLYEVVRATPVFGRLLSLVAPLIEATGTVVSKGGKGSMSSEVLSEIDDTRHARR